MLGSGYALAAWRWLPTLRGVPQLMLAALGMAALSFGRHALKMGPLVLACSLPSREACSVEITLRGKTMRLPALRDSGS